MEIIISNSFVENNVKLFIYCCINGKYNWLSLGYFCRLKSKENEHQKKNKENLVYYNG